MASEKILFKKIKRTGLDAKQVTLMGTCYLCYKLKDFGSAISLDSDLHACVRVTEMHMHNTCMKESLQAVLEGCSCSRQSILVAMQYHVLFIAIEFCLGMLQHLSGINVDNVNSTVKLISKC